MVKTAMMTAGERMRARAVEIVNTELEAWAVPPREVLAVLEAAHGRALHGEPAGQWPPPVTAGDLAEQATAYVLLRLHRELGYPLDSVVEPRAVDLLAAMLDPQAGPAAFRGGMLRRVP
jgi:hypothetical protein